MKKYGTWATQLINSIDEVHGAETNTTSADIMRIMNGRKAERSGLDALVASSDEAPASFHWRG